MSQPTTPRPGTGSPTNGSAPSTPVEERKHLEGRSPPFTSSFHSAPFQAGIRKRRADSIFPVEAGPFFSTTKQLLNLSSMDRSNGYKVRINAKVGRFFLADNDWTCYRRNYFQVSSAFSIIGTNAMINDSETPCLVEIDGQFHTVNAFLLGITARVSNSEKKIELVQHTPKRDKGPQITPVAKQVRAGGNLNLSSVGSNQNIVTFERVQFKTATANNGKRRAAQQYYVIIVDLYVQTDSGDHKVATCQSAPLVVRGRSPGHYADNHERFNHMIGPSSPDDRFLASYRTGAPGTPVGMPADYNYSAYPSYPPYPQFSPVNPPLRNDTLSMLMSNPPGGPHPSYPHPPQSYMVPSISDGSNSESPSPDLYTNEFSPDPNEANGGHPNHHTPKLSHMPPPGHPHHQPIGLNIQGVHAADGPDAWNRARQNSSTSVTSFVSSSTSSHSNEEPQYPPYTNGAPHSHDAHHGHPPHSAFTSFDSRQPPPAAGYQPHEYDDFQWHNGNHQHHHGYPEGAEQPYPHTNGNNHSNGHPPPHAPESNGRPHENSNPGSKPSSRGQSTTSSAPNSGSSSQWDPSASRGHPGTPTQELGKQMMNFRIAKLEEAGDKL